MNSTLRSALVGLAVAVALPAVAQTEGGSGGRYPIAYGDRPVTLPANTLRGRFDLNLGNLSFGTAFGSVSEFSFGIIAGASYGILDNVEVGIDVLPIRFTPSGGFDIMPLYGQFAITRDFAVKATMFLPTASGSRFGLGLGGDYVLRFGAVRLDLGAGMVFTFTDSVIYSLQVPVKLSYNLSPQLYLAVETGLSTTKFDLIGIPLGFGAYYTIPSGNVPFLEIGGSFAWRGFGSGSSTGLGGGGLFNFGDLARDTVNASNFQILLGVKGYFFL